MPFERTTHAVLTVIVSVEMERVSVQLTTHQVMDWRAQVDDSLSFRMGLLDDGSLSISSLLKLH